MRLDLPDLVENDPRERGVKNLYPHTQFRQLNVLGELPGVCTYEELTDRTVSVEFGGAMCRVLDIERLIAAKKVAGRPHDLQTIRMLEQFIKRHLLDSDNLDRQ